MRKQMEGDNRERRKMAGEARDEGKRASEIGASTGASKQRQKAPSNASHQKRLDLKREGKVRSARVDAPPPEAGQRGRDEHGPDADRYPRL